MLSFFELDELTTLPVMLTVAAGLAVFWAFVLEIMKKAIFNALPGTTLWKRAAEPQTALMYNFGYPSSPTAAFPEGTTDAMARDGYAFVITIVLQHGLSALAMLPVLLTGWDEASVEIKTLFVMGTLSDVGFDIYDATQNTIRAFTKIHPLPIPFEFWFIIVFMHHTLALSLVLPMNLSYVHRWEYHQTAVSLLFAASLCYGAGSMKFALDIVHNQMHFILYKAVVLFQMVVILYTRLYLWFPAAYSFREHVKEQGDTVFVYASSVVMVVFSLFNLILVADAVGAAAKSIPKKFGKNEAERRNTASDLRRRLSALDMPGAGLTCTNDVLLPKRRFKSAVHSVIAVNRMMSSVSSSEDDKKTK